MIFKNKKLRFIALLSMMPFLATSGPVDTCLAVGQAVVNVGKTAATIEHACDLSGCQTAEPIALASGVYNLGMTTHLLGSMWYGMAALPYRLCFGFPEANTTSATVTLCDNVNSALHGISTFKAVCSQGYDLVPDSIKWAARSAIPDSVKVTCQNAEKFIDSHKYLKLMALSTYVAYKTSLQRITMIDTISNAYGEIAMMKMYGRLGYSLVPDCLKNAVPAPIKSKIHAIKNFVNEHKVVKAAAFAGYVAYKLYQQNLNYAAYNTGQSLHPINADSLASHVVSSDIMHDQLVQMGMAVTS